MEKDQIIKWGVIILILYLLFIMFNNYIATILVIFVFSYVLLPVYDFLNRHINKHVSALICVLIFILIILLPVLVITIRSIQELSNISISNITSLIDQIPYIDNIRNSTNISGSLMSIVTSGLSSFATFLLKLFIIIFGIYYVIKNWNKVSSKIKSYLPIKKKKEYFDSLASTTKGIIYGLLFVASYDFLIALIGFSIAGIQSPILFALLVGIFAFTYLLDPFIIWMPLTIYYFYTGNLYTAIGVLITGLLILTDAFIRPKVLGKFAQINPYLMLLGIIGGVAAFGIIGLIMGPIILIASISLIDHI